MSKRIIFVEGSISSGKSSCLAQLKSLDYFVLEEPLETWQKEYVEDDGTSIFELFYKDMGRWSFDFEIAVMTTRFKILLQAIECPQQTVFIERSLFTDCMVFEKNLFEQGLITPMQNKIYQDWYKTFMSAINHILESHKIEFLYIDTPPAICFERKIGRNRTEEEFIAPDYFFKLHDKHCNWLLNENMKYPVTVINGSVSKEEVVKQILDFIKGE